MEEIEDILKNHANPRAIKIDPNDQECNERFLRAQKMQEETLDRKNVDWQKLEKTFITI